MHLIGWEPDNAYFIFSLPTKNEYWLPSPIVLIERSLKELVSLVDHTYKAQNIVLPRPGCGLGGLDWETAVKPLCEKYLDDRFTVVHNA